MRTAAIYIRVSKKEQNPDNQQIALQTYAKHRGFQETLVYVDVISGARKERRALSDLMRDAKMRRFDAVIVTRFDRFARSVSHLVGSLEEFQAIGIDFISLGESIDTTTPIGKMVFHIAAAFAEFERNIIRERINLGLDRARKQGKQLGRPKSIFDRQEVFRLSAMGMSAHGIARTLKVSPRTVRRVLGQKGSATFSVVDAGAKGLT